MRDYCHSCNGTEFKPTEEGIQEYVESDYKFYIEEEGYDENEVDCILIDI